MRAVPNKGNQVCLVAVVEGEVHPRREEAIFGGAENGKSNVLGEILLVVLEDSAPLSLVVAPGGEQLGGKLIVGISDYLANEDELTLRYLVADRRNVEEPLTN